MPTDDMTEAEREQVFKEMLSDKMREIGAKGKKSRWSKMSKKERSEWGKMMAQARSNKKENA